ncbi:MAG: hypothetical protein HY094_02845 [Candidatus Melainabacteria bacterium]|nr:hypothetical protein [Candidatus Melainabacteria bacterium]
MRVANLPYWTYKHTMPNLSPIISHMTNTKQRVLDSSCAPVAAANIISYLAHHNRARLLPPQGNSSRAYIHTKLVEKLIRYMNTTISGTSDLDLITGIEKYIVDRGYKIKLSWVGDSYTGKHKESSTVDPEWVMQGTLGLSNVILCSGDYKYSSRYDLYKRICGHAVTLAGFNTAYNELLIHDPARVKKPICCELITLKGKKLSDENGGYHLGSRFYELREFDDESIIRVIEDVLCFEVYPK